MRLYQQCTAPSPHDRPTFEVLMRDLALLESRVRVEGARISRECSRWGGGSGLEHGLKLVNRLRTVVQSVRRLEQRLERCRRCAWGTCGGYWSCVAVR